MLKIRMQRVGRINMPSYRIIVVEHTEGPKTGKFTDIVGTYDPRRKERKLDETKIKYWMSVGAKPSDTVHNMFVSAGIVKGKKINVLPKFVEPEKPASPEATQGGPTEEAAPAPEAPAAEAPAEEAAPEAPAAEASAPEEAAPEEPNPPAGGEEAPAQ